MAITEDHFCEIEILVDEVLEILRRNYNDERLVGERTAMTAALTEPQFMHGDPAIIPCKVGIAVFEKTEFPFQDCGGPASTVWQNEQRIGIKWWCLEPNFSRAHRIIARMGTVIKRIIQRNPRLVDATDVAHSGKTTFDEPISLGREVKEAFTGNRVAFARGELTLKIELTEALVPKT